MSYLTNDELGWLREAVSVRAWLRETGRDAREAFADRDAAVVGYEGWVWRKVVTGARDTAHARERFANRPECTRSAVIGALRGLSREAHTRDALAANAVYRGGTG